MKGHYLGNKQFDQDTINDLYQSFEAEQSVGYHFRSAKINNKILFTDYDSLKEYVNKTKSIRLIHITFQKNKNKRHLFNNKYMPYKWFRHEEIENEYDVVERDKYLMYKYNQEVLGISEVKKSKLFTIPTFYSLGHHQNNIAFGIYGISIILIIIQHPIGTPLGFFTIVLGLLQSIYKYTRNGYKNKDRK